MNLIAYSDSESDGEAAPAPKPALKQAPKSSFQKVVDRANPGRIKVSLPGASQAHTTKDDIEDDAPPAKKPRLGGASAFGGFNAMLPAPKKPVAAPASSSATPGKRALGKGLASGVNLKTGAEPAFKRESRVEAEDYDENGNPVKKEPMNKDDFRALLNLPPPKSEKKEEATKEARAEIIPAESQAVPKPAAPRFVPMSVGKGKKKKPIVPRTAAPSSSDTASSASASASTQSNTVPAAPVRKPKVSLFGVSQEATAPAIESGAGAYEPMLYGARDEDDPGVPDEAFDGNFVQQSQQRKVHAAHAPPSNELTNMATELHLSEAERRQLFGKKGREADFSAAKIVEFNTDTEYAHNEKLRQQGEQVQHNALKSISGTGKNSLRSLVNVASTQKDALEEHFAAGYRNKKEAGNRYGW
ncbi:mitotic checkpoint regulator, MAD2B-interacting-domain-containing protein [Paraphoma chrysanthemicola]|nr:mitotic checkpoint regulator, MAD2B-interacting-domain-containing protein [Paraphoma chrysanthemicola]